jgi:hypothetical protein
MGTTEKPDVVGNVAFGSTEDQKRYRHVTPHTFMTEILAIHGRPGGDLPKPRDRMPDPDGSGAALRESLEVARRQDARTIEALLEERLADREMIAELLNALKLLLDDSFVDFARVRDADLTAVEWNARKVIERAEGRS